MQKENLNLETLGFIKNKKTVEVAYQNYLDNKPGSEGELYATVVKFARGKITTRLFDSPESAEDVEDHVQEVALKVWGNIGLFKGDAESFYHWVHKISYRQGLAAAIATTKEFKKRVDLFVESEEGDMDDNPLLYNGQEVREHARELPEFIKGTDLLICKLMREDFTYEEIGQRTGLTEEAVEIRIRRIREKVEALNLPKQRADYLAECDKSWAEAKGPIVRNEDPMVRSGEPYSDWLTWYSGEVDRARAKYDI